METNIHALILAHGKDAARDMLSAKEKHLVDLAADAMAIEAFDGHDVGFLYSGWAMTALPHRRPSDGREHEPWTRENGRFRLMVEPGHIYDSKWNVEKVGIPYGSRARLILFYLQTEAVRRKSPEIELGTSLRRWLSRMGISDAGPNYAAVRDQSRRLSACRLTIGWSSDDGTRGFERASIVNRMMFVPNGDDRQGALWDETARLSPEFFESLISHPVPVAEHAIRALQNSSLSLDVYTWLCYRLRSLSKPTTVSWSALHQQFGPEYATVKSFRERFVMNLRESLCVYPEAQVDISASGVILHPSPAAVPERMPVRQLRAI